MKPLTENQLLVLVACGMFKHISSKQLIERLHVASNSSNLTIRVLRRLLELDLIGCFHAPMYGVGKRHYVYFLTSKGYQYLLESPEVDLDRIRIPKKSVVSFPERDRNHRLRTIDFFLTYMLSIRNGDLLATPDYQTIQSSVLTYYDTTKDATNAQPVSEARFVLPNRSIVVPDLVIRAHDPVSRHTSIFLVELAYTPNLTHITNGFQGHCELICAGVVASALDLPKQLSHRVLFVFEDDQTRDKARERFITFCTENGYHQKGSCPAHFRFATYSDVEKNIMGEQTWMNARGTHKNPFLTESQDAPTRSISH